jgi:hypothetical protein
LQGNEIFDSQAESSPYACAPIATGGSFLWIEMAAGCFNCRENLDERLPYCSTTREARF